MQLALSVLLISGLLEIVVASKPVWQSRKSISTFLFGIDVLFTLVLISSSLDSVFAIVFAFSVIYRLFNIYRAITSKIQPEHLRRITQLTSSKLWLGQLVLSLIWAISSTFHESNNLRWYILSSASTLIGLVLVSSTARNSRVTRAINLSTKLVDSKTPTLSVAIPARNETDTLNECLMSLIASDYPKLEILVLDDQSTTKRTPEIIRSFAHDGVTFIPGTEFNSEWLAKNWAYQTLLEAANGEIILFCGADTRFSTESLRFLVSSLVSRDKQVLSILPQNVLPPNVYSRILQPLRYCWEIALPRRLFNRPPILSTCWVARKDFLLQNGGFKAVSRRISPESYFAKLALKVDGYSFFQYPRVTSAKPTHDQQETALRLRYPQVHRQPEMVGLISLIEAGCLLSLFGIFLYALIEQLWPLVFIDILGIGVFSLVFGMVSAVTYDRRILLSYLLWPLAIVTDVYLLNLSMWRYEFGTVLWKGRSIAPAVMTHKTPSLESAHEARQAR